MKGAKYKDYIHRYKIMMLLGVLICFSYCTEYTFETEKNTKAATFARSSSLPTSLTDFFSYSCNGLDSVINTIKNINKKKNFISGFLKKYGIPLWNYTLILKDEDEVSFYVPLYQGKSNLSIDAFWFFHITDGKIVYAPFRRTDNRIKNHEQRFIFDLLSWMVFGEKNASGLIFKEQESSSRGWIITERCWVTYTGTEGNLEYRDSHCSLNAFWVDETVYWITTAPEDDLSGGSTTVGGGGNSGTGGGGSSSASASDIFSNDDFNDVSWNMADYLLEDILNDCMGEALFNGIKEKLNGDKIKFRFIENEASSYNLTNRTLSISVDQLESNVLFHEMFHLYQSLSESQSSFINHKMNREIETHFAQYLFRKKQAFLFDLETDSLFLTNEKLHACRTIENYVDDYGVIKDGTGLSLAEHLEYVVVDAFRNQGYGNYPFNYESIDMTFRILKELTNNCNP